MNRTALSVIALAVGSVLIIGLFNIYKPATKHLANDVFSKIKIGHMGPPEKTGTYDGLKYNDWGNGEIEITGGHLKDNQWSYGLGLLSSTNSPKEFKHAKSITFDDKADINGVTDIDNMFANSPDLQSVDLGNNFDTSNVNNRRYGLDSMFEHDPNLTHVNLGPKFNKQSNLDGAYWNIFLGDKKLNSIQGNVSPDVQKAFNHRMTPFPGSHEQS